MNKTGSRIITRCPPVLNHLLSRPLQLQKLFSADTHRLKIIFRFNPLKAFNEIKFKILNGREGGRGVDT